MPAQRHVLFLFLNLVIASSGANTITTIDNPANAVGQATSVAIGSDGLPIISYHDVTDGALKVAKCLTSTCTSAMIRTLDNGAAVVGRFTSIAIGSDGMPVIAYQGGSKLKVVKCSNAECGLGAIAITTVNDPVGEVGAYTSMAIGTDGLPVISYEDHVSFALRVAKCADLGCASAAFSTVDDQPNNAVGEFTSIAIGTDGLPVIAYLDATASTLKVAKCANAACTGDATITVVDDSAGLVGYYASMTIGGDGRPVIGYYDNTALSLKVAACANAACSGSAEISTIDDSANDVGAFASIAVGGDGLPVLGYWDASAGALKVAKCTDASCAGPRTITTVDDPENRVGAHVDLAIGGDGLPFLSYEDFTSRALKVVKCFDASCVGKIFFGDGFEGP